MNTPDEKMVNIPVCKVILCMAEKLGPKETISILELTVSQLRTLCERGRQTAHSTAEREILHQKPENAKLWSTL